jgi:hypothetical protein
MGLDGVNEFPHQGAGGGVEVEEAGFVDLRDDEGVAFGQRKRIGECEGVGLRGLGFSIHPTLSA